MKTSFCWILLGFAAGWLPTALAQGQTGTPTPAGTTAPVADPAYGLPATPGPAGPREGSRVSLFREPAGKLVLVVRYPWTLHAKPSVEVRLLGEGEPDDGAVRPMCFRSKYMKGPTTVAVYRCQDGCENSPTTVPIKEQDVEFEALGNRNSLGAPAVCVARQVVRKDATFHEGPAMEPGAAAAFPLLEPWALDKGLLYLDLPKDYFAESGRMRVWYLRRDRIVWSEDLAWPGLGGTGTKKRAPAEAPAAKKPPSKPHPVAVPKPSGQRPEPKARPKREPKPRTKRPRKGQQEPGGF